MFDGRQILELAETHRATFRALDDVRQTLEAEFFGLHDAILALILSVASAEPLLLIGPPGTAKSTIIRRFCTLAGIDSRSERGGYFEYLLTPFTEPAELWGFYDPRSVHEGKLLRIGEDIMMQNASVVFLDEVFKGSSAILNSLLSFMNERVFYDRGQRRPVKLQCLFAATNDLPDSAELQAVADRFAVRCRVENAASDVEHLGALLQKAWPLTYSGRQGASAHRPGLLPALAALRDDITKRQLFRLQPDALGVLAMLVQTTREYRLSRMSNRRLVKFVYVMLIHRVYEAALDGVPADSQLPAIRRAELKLLAKYFLDDDTNEEAVRQMTHSIEQYVKH